MYMKNKHAFTMVELIFVIVILGILASVAIPKFGSTMQESQIAKGRADIASIRTGIVSERQSRLISGDSAWITPSNLDSGGLFKGVLMYPIPNKNSAGNWYTANTGNGNYNYIVGDTSVVFDYNSTSGVFTCNPLHATYGTICGYLIN